MLQILLLCILGTSQAVPVPVSNFLGYHLPYFYNFNQPNPLAVASISNPNNFGFSFPPAQAAPTSFPQINPLAHLNNGATSFPQVGLSGSVIPYFSPVRQNIQSFQPPLSHSFASSQPHVALQPYHHPLAASFPQLGRPVHNSLSGFHHHYNPNHYSTSPTLNSYEPKVEFQRINLPPIVRENKLEIRQPVLNTVRYVQPTLYKINRHRVDVNEDKYDFDDDDYERGYPLQSQPTVLTYSIRSPSRDYIQEHSPLSYAIGSQPTLFKRSHLANYHDDHEFEDEEIAEPKFKSAGKHEEASGEEDEAADEEE